MPPNREPYVVLECGCVRGAEFCIKLIGGPSYQTCEVHENDGKYGQRILREASISEILRFYYGGKAAPKRRAKRAPIDLSDLPGGYDEAPQRTRTDQPTLF